MRQEGEHSLTVEYMMIKSVLFIISFQYNTLRHENASRCHCEQQSTYATHHSKNLASPKVRRFLNIDIIQRRLSNNNTAGWSLILMACNDRAPYVRAHLSDDKVDAA